MVELIKKKCGIGSQIIIHTKDNFFSGTIEGIEENCIVLETEENVEFISSSEIVRFSIPKATSKIKTIIDTPSEISEIVRLSQCNTEQSTSQSKNYNLDLKETAKDTINFNPNPLSTTINEEIKISHTGSNEDHKILSSSKNDTKEDLSIKPITEYKVGEIIPRELLEKHEKIQSIKSNSKSGKSIKFKSFEELEQYFHPEDPEEGKKIVSATGFVIKVFSDRSFGFIQDKFGYDFWFSFQNVLDDDLIKTLNLSNVRCEIPVVFTGSSNFKGNIALFIQKPNSIKSFLDKAILYANERKFEKSIGILNQIIFSYPDCRSATKILNSINDNLLKQNNTKVKTNEINYQRATKAKNVDKDYETALKYYKLALENNEKKESCIKDIAMLYVAMGDIENAVNFMQGYENKLPLNITTFNYLSNFYSSVKQFRKAIENLDYILRDSFIAKDKRKHSLYLSQKGFALIQLKEINDAKQILEMAVEISPDNTYAARLLKAIEEKDEVELNIAIAEAEFDSFGGGYSKLIKDTIDKYDQYFGVPAKVIDAGDFTKETLNAIRRLIETAGRARPRERANYLLTEAKLMMLLESEKESELRSVFARYCNAMALNHIVENSPMDVIRNYYIESFSIDENFDRNKRQISVFLFSFRSQYSELLSATEVLLDDALKYALDGEYREAVWEGVLSMFLWNRSISAQLISKLFRNQKYRAQSLVFLQRQNINAQNLSSLEDYISLWNQLREKRQRDYSKWLASVKAIHSVISLDVLVNQLVDSLEGSKRSWLNQLDLSRLNIISSDIYEILVQYLRQSGYREKERFYNICRAQINQLINEIRERPTKFSYEGFIPLLEKIDLLLEKSFKIVELASEPVIKISILGEASIISTEKIVPIKILVENSKNSSPIRDISIEIGKNSEILHCDRGVFYDSIDGGENAEIHLKASVSDKVIIDKATTIDVRCSYKKRNQEEPIEIKDQLSLRLYSEEEFETISNPYEKLANGGPVTDTSMFYGRNEFIERITEAIIQSVSKQVVIYGQKRSGKSSVLFHLKKALENTDKTFCIAFSIGDIYENISSATFFYKILSLIEEELENLEQKSLDVPKIKFPSFSEFRDYPNPSDLFRKYIRLFNRECSLIDNWREKKLVVMIDEFTYLYTSIKEGKVSDSFMKQWKAITQNEEAAFSSVLVGQDVFPLFKDEFPNEFGVTQDERLTYLSKDDAIKLIEEPIGKTKTNRNRFIGNAVDTIIEYTSCNPYYIQIFCARLVNEMNRKKYIEVTSADVKEIAESFINGGQALTDDKFDNLLNAGEKYDIQEIPQKDSKEILRIIASNAKNIGFCLREQISLGDGEYEDKILHDLVKREVLEQKGNSYKIQVKLFQEWLLKH